MMNQIGNLSNSAKIDQTNDNSKDPSHSIESSNDTSNYQTLNSYDISNPNYDNYNYDDNYDNINENNNGAGTSSPAFLCC